MIARAYGFSIFKFIAFIKEEIMLVLGTSSSESALPRMMDKLEKYGCSKSVVGLVVPTGYSFNLDGTAIYLSMAAMFVAQASGVEMTIWQQLTLLGILMVTSKGAAGVTVRDSSRWLPPWPPFLPSLWRVWHCSSASTGSCRKRAPLRI